MRKISITIITLLSAAAFAGTASAGDPKGAKPVAPPPDTTTTAPPADSMAMPTPAPELLAFAKTLKGTWKCKASMQGTTDTIKGTMKWSLDLDKMWIKGVLSMGKIKGQSRGYKANFFRTYSNGAWSHVSLGNMGEYGVATSKGPDEAGKLTWDGQTTIGGLQARSRDYEQPGDKKGTMHIWGEISADGKNWMPTYDMTCSK